jgi:hypothetical protein
MPVRPIKPVSSRKLTLITLLACLLCMATRLSAEPFGHGCPDGSCPPTGGMGALGVGEDNWLERPYAPGLYWIGPESHLRPPCPQLYEYLPGHFQPVYGGQLPRWYVSAEYLALFRDEDKSVPFASLGPDPNSIVLSTSDFNAEFQSGVRATIGRQMSDHIRLEGTYFGSYTWSDQASVNNLDPNALAGVGNLFSPFTGFGNPADPAVDYNSVAVIDYSSRLNNAEINLRHRLLMPPSNFEVSALLGVRYMNIDESFGYLTSTSVGDINEMSVDANNDLIGVQMGLLGQFLFTPWTWVDWEMKGAIANNSASQNTVYVDNQGSQFVGGRDENSTSFIGETSVILNYQVRPSITFRVGYQALWVTGLALADQNFQTNLATLTLGPAQLKHDADMVYHGFNIGLVFAR